MEYQLYLYFLCWARTSGLQPCMRNTSFASSSRSMESGFGTRSVRISVGNDSKSQLASLDHATNVSGLVLGCIGAHLLKLNTYSAAFFKIYKIRTLLHRVSSGAVLILASTIHLHTQTCTRDHQRRSRINCLLADITIYSLGLVIAVPCHWSTK